MSSAKWWSFCSGVDELNAMCLLMAVTKNKHYEEDHLASKTNKSDASICKSKLPLSASSGGISTLSQHIKKMNHQYKQIKTKCFRVLTFLSVCTKASGMPTIMSFYDGGWNFESGTKRQTREFQMHFWEQNVINFKRHFIETGSWGLDGYAH